MRGVSPVRTGGDDCSPYQLCVDGVDELGIQIFFCNAKANGDQIKQGRFVEGRGTALCRFFVLASEHHFFVFLITAGQVDCVWSELKS